MTDIALWARLLAPWLFLALAFALIILGLHTIVTARAIQAEELRRSPPRLERLCGRFIGYPRDERYIASRSYLWSVRMGGLCAVVVGVVTIVLMTLVVRSR